MPTQTYNVLVAWDENERRFFVERSDIPGLWLTSATFDGLLDAIKDVAAELIEANCKPVGLAQRHLAKGPSVRP